MLAFDRDEYVIDLPDVLAGIYINSLEKIAKYWPDLESIETFVEKHCGINPQRWDYWIEHHNQTYNAFRKRSRKFQIRLPFLKRKPRSYVGVKFQQSADLLAVCKIAESMATSQSEPFDKKLPVVTLESFLLAAVKHTSPISELLRELGLDVAKLEADVRNPKRLPRL